MYNLLTDPLIRFNHSNNGAVQATLPEVYVALMTDKVESFSALRPHQRHAWHAFLVQLGAMAINQGGENDPPEDAATWTKFLLGLTSDFPDDDPWHLVVEDITKPAFMQAPASSKKREKDYKSRVTTPDGLDMLVTSKNHDLKAATVFQASPDYWIFALITLQTMQGFSGNKNYGISRMNGGMGSRPAFGFTPSERFGAHVKRDIAVLLEQRSSLAEEFQFTREGT